MMPPMKERMTMPAIEPAERFVPFDAMEVEGEVEPGGRVELAETVGLAPVSGDEGE